MTKLLYFAPILFAACAVDGGDPVEGETDQALTGSLIVSHTCTPTSNGTPCNYDLGTASNRACVLAGLDGGAGLAGGSIVSVGAEGGEESLSIYTTVGYPITATVLCVSPAQHVVADVHWQAGWAPRQITGTTASSRCFLSQVAAAAGGFGSYNDNVQTYQSGGSWWVGGTVANGYLDANATCFDATDNGSWSWGQLGGTTSGNLASNSAGGVGCALTALGGWFQLDSLSDGVAIGYNGGLSQWTWTFGGGMHAAAECIR